MFGFYVVIPFDDAGRGWLRFLGSVDGFEIVVVFGLGVLS